MTLLPQFSATACRQNLGFWQYDRAQIVVEAVSEITGRITRLELVVKHDMIEHMPSAPIQLTQEQHLALEQCHAEPLRAVDPATNAQYVLVRSDDYELLTAAVSQSEWAREAYPTAVDVFARDGWDDPRMDVYDVPDGAAPRQSP